MRVLFDTGRPRALAFALKGHTVVESRSLGWEELKNGDLLEAPESAGYEVFVTTDKNIKYQQNLSKRKISLVVLGRGRWHLIQAVIADVLEAVNSSTPGSFIEVLIPDK